MSLIIEDNKENNDITPLFLTPISDLENRLKEDECYSCSECSSGIEILDLDEENNQITFKCPLDGQKTMTIKEYLDKMVKNTFLYTKCSLCQKQQNKIDNNQIFKYCFNCKIYLCNKCLFNHEQNHIFIENDKLNIKCKLHPKNKNKSYYIDCNLFFVMIV